jgi:DNA-directed RNA polymerase specialized sigma24 family protein
MEGILSKDPGAKPDETPATPTETEIRSALEGLRRSNEQQQRVAKVARLLFAYYPILADNMEPGDLIHEAVVAVLEGRRDWDMANVDFPMFLIGVMRSLAYNEARKAHETRPRYVRESDLEHPESSDDREGFLASVPADTPSPEKELIKNEEEAEEEALLAIIQAQLSDDPEVMRVLELELEGVPKREIRERLRMESKQFWTIDRRILRTFEVAAKQRRNHDD